IAAYPHLKGDELAEQAQALANRAYEEAAQRLPGSLREMEFAVSNLGMPESESGALPLGDTPTNYFRTGRIPRRVLNMVATTGFE
ncbi:alpha/beta hydrolase, partial [Salmonella enterica subsp. enterica serovar Montevideo]|nr:alpha/beta hydrolase [Salmonella enterica subsp. enterica serovar Montevideo]